MIQSLIDLAEKGAIPDTFLKLGIHHLCGQRLKDLKKEKTQNPQYIKKYVETLRNSPIAVHTKSANEQHYEVPAPFFTKVLGRHMKYSCAYWSDKTKNLDQAETQALSISIERAEISNGMKILELGCGWGSLTLTMARKFPLAQITAVSNSHSQKKFIDQLAASENLKNVRVVTADFSELEAIPDIDMQFDRIVSIEMFEHLSNYEATFQKLKRWLKPSGKVFLHIFIHKELPYKFEVQKDDDWMSKYFFTGGQMPSADLFSMFDKDLEIEKKWIWDGTHYKKTSDAWLQNMDKNKSIIMPILEQTYGKEAEIWFHRWRMFFLAVSGLFGYGKGQEWQVAHYLFTQKGKTN